MYPSPMREKATIERRVDEEALIIRHSRLDMSTGKMMLDRPSLDAEAKPLLWTQEMKDAFFGRMEEQVWTPASILTSHYNFCTIPFAYKCNFVMLIHQFPPQRLFRPQSVGGGLKAKQTRFIALSARSSPQSERVHRVLPTIQLRSSCYVTKRTGGDARNVWKFQT
jgi:hypothetical protein